MAQYTAQHFPAFLKQLDAYKRGNVSQALEEAFLGFDATLKEESVIQVLKELAGVDCEGDGTSLYCLLVTCDLEFIPYIVLSCGQGHRQAQAYL